MSSDELTTALARRDRLQSELASMLDPIDQPTTWTERQCGEYELTRRRLHARIRDVTNATEKLAQVEPLIPTMQELLVRLEGWRQESCVKLLEPRGRSRREFGEQRNYELSVRALDRGLSVLTDTGFGLETLFLGTLMRRDGYVEAPPIENQLVGSLPWFGSIPEIEGHLRVLQAQRDDALKRLAIDARYDEVVTT